MLGILSVVYMAEMLQNLHIEYIRGNIYMFGLKDDSELIGVLERNYVSSKIIDIEFYGKCKEICESYDIKELKHAKAVLEE